MTSVANTRERLQTIHDLRNQLIALDAAVDRTIAERDRTQAALTREIVEHPEIDLFDLDRNERVVLRAEDDATVRRMNEIAAGPDRDARLIEVLSACRDPKLPNFLRKKFEPLRKRLLAEQCFSEGITPCLIERDSL